MPTMSDDLPEVSDKYQAEPDGIMNFIYNEQYVLLNLGNTETGWITSDTIMERKDYEGDF